MVKEKIINKEKGDREMLNSVENSNFEKINKNNDEKSNNNNETDNENHLSEEHDNIETNEEGQLVESTIDNIETNEEGQINKNINFDEINKLMGQFKLKQFNNRKKFKQVEEICFKIIKNNTIKYDFDILKKTIDDMHLKFIDDLKENKKNANDFGINLFFNVHISVLKKIEINLRSNNYYNNIKKITEDNKQKIIENLKIFTDKNIEFFHILNGIILNEIEINDILNKIESVVQSDTNSNIDFNDILNYDV